MWHYVQGEVEGIMTDTLVGCLKVYDVTEEQLQGLMWCDPVSLIMEHDSLFAA